ncbi:MAG: hypothetical protein KAW56_06000 [Candidatus Marinimicrobia bacterium]|nr:hypothetical protein [Candidatus Neomarinimicrobiota bacterium]
MFKNTDKKNCLDDYKKLLKKYEFYDEVENEYSGLYNISNIYHYLDYIQRYEEEKNKKVTHIFYDFQQKKGVKKFDVNTNNLIEYTKQELTDLREKLYEGILDLPWEYFHYFPWEPVIIDDIYYRFDNYRNRVAIWAVDFTKPLEKRVIGPRDDRKHVYTCHFFGLDDVYHAYYAIGFFYQPYTGYLNIPYGNNLLYSLSPTTWGVKQSTFPFYYRIMGIGKEKGKIKKFIGYPKYSTHFEMS